MIDHTPISKVSRLEVVSTGARRRWTLEEEQRIVAESYGCEELVQPLRARGPTRFPSGHLTASAQSGRDQGAAKNLDLPSIRADGIDGDIGGSCRCS